MAMQQHTLGELQERFSFISGPIITFVAGLLGAGLLMGGLADKGLDQPVVPAIGLGLLIVAISTFFRSPRKLEIHAEGMLIKRGLKTERVVWSQVEQVRHDKEGVRVNYTKGSFEIYSGSSGKKKTRKIADALAAASGLCVH